jgi:hypothetical protein
MRMVAHRIADGVIPRLIGKWLRAGVMQDGVVIRTEGEAARRPDDAPYAKGNFQFERVIAEWRTRPVLDLRRK